MNSATARQLNKQFVYKEIDLDLLDEPKRNVRESIDGAALEELAESIAAVGLIKPLIVLQRGDRYEVDAGHRRLLACRRVKYTPVPCRIKVNDLVSARAIMVHENDHTEEVNPIEQARFYAEYMTEECENDVDILCSKVRKKREFVEGRLNLLVGHPRVIGALEHSLIPIGVAQQLNRIHDEGHLLLLLDQAINQGASVRTVTQWVREANASEPVQLPPMDLTQAVDDNGAPTPIFEQKCWFCRSAKHAHTFRWAWIHATCEDIMRDALHLPSGEDAESAAA